MAVEPNSDPDAVLGVGNGGRQGDGDRVGAGHADTQAAPPIRLGWRVVDRSRWSPGRPHRGPQAGRSWAESRTQPHWAGALFLLRAFISSERGRCAAAHRTPSRSASSRGRVPADLPAAQTASVQRAPFGGCNVGSWETLVWP